MRAGQGVYKFDKFVPDWYYNLCKAQQIACLPTSWQRQEALDRVCDKAKQQIERMVKEILHV